MPIDAYVEVGTKRVFAGALDWPGWCRSGRTVDDALEVLLAYGPRYAEVIRGAKARFTLPKTASSLAIVDRLTGDATTDFGAPSIAPAADARPLDRRWLTRQTKILQACWEAFDRAVESATGAELRKGPRGGGRELDAIIGHVVGAEASYSRMIGAKTPGAEDDASAKDDVRAVVLDGLERAVADGIPAEGPRGRHSPSAAPGTAASRRRGSRGTPSRSRRRPSTTGGARVARVRETRAAAPRARGPAASVRGPTRPPPAARGCPRPLRTTGRSPSSAVRFRGSPARPWRSLRP